MASYFEKCLSNSLQLHPTFHQTFPDGPIPKVLIVIGRPQLVHLECTPDFTIMQANFMIMQANFTMYKLNKLWKNANCKRLNASMNYVLSIDG